MSAWYVYRLPGGGAYMCERIRPGVYLVRTTRGADYVRRTGTRAWSIDGMPGITADSMRRALAILHERNQADAERRTRNRLLA